jgi:hypothetical protein
LFVFNGKGLALIKFFSRNKRTKIRKDKRPFYFDIINGTGGHFPFIGFIANDWIMPKDEIEKKKKNGRKKRKPDFRLRHIVEARRRPSEEVGLGVGKTIKEKS